MGCIHAILNNLKVFLSLPWLQGLLSVRLREKKNDQTKHFSMIKGKEKDSKYLQFLYFNKRRNILKKN